MSAAEILSRRLAEVDARKDSEREAVRALFAKYPDIAAFAQDMKAAFPGELTNFKYAIHGPINDRRLWVQPVLGSHAQDKKGKKA